MRKLFTSEIIAGILIVVFVVIFLAVLFQAILAGRSSNLLISVPGLHISKKTQQDFFKSFDSIDDMRRYIELWNANSYVDGMGMADRAAGSVDMDAMSPQMEDAGGKMTQMTVPDRVSGTNVQVVGIDEPDIIKTDGKELYISREEQWFYTSDVDDDEAEPMPMPMLMMNEVLEDGIPASPIAPLKTDSVQYPSPTNRKMAATNIVRAFPVDDLGVDSEITRHSGNMLLGDDTLVVFDAQGLYGYNVSNPKDPQEVWDIQFKEADALTDARMVGGTLYVVTRTNINASAPCPIRPLSVRGADVMISCEDILYPRNTISPEALYTVSKIDVETGEIRENQTMLGTYNMVMAFFGDGLYLGYEKRAGLLDLMTDFFRENPQLVPQDVFTRIERIRDYDISEQSKLTEFQLALSRYEASLSSDARLRFGNELNNAQTKYLEKRKRDLVGTSIVRLDTKTLNVDAVGFVPGMVLNQFSIDSFDGYLRVATTIGGNVWQFGGQVKQTNDLYMLDKDLKTVGSVQDFGDGERIYSVRFVEDEGYVVTFKQVDPFFVFDLSNPKNPRKTGELKIPGYSSYLHPLGSDRILGVGKEGNKVKVSLFDVSNAASPRELSTYQLDEYWSDVLSTHHAFLQDEKHRVFFLPGSKGGYIFSYVGDTLSMEKAVSGDAARRAVYIDDYLYIVGKKTVTVIDENTWETVGELEL